LIRDEQRRILTFILDHSLAAAEEVYRTIYQDHAALMRFVTAMHLPVPPAFLTAAKFVLNEQVRRAFETGEVDFTTVNADIAEARRSGVVLDETAIGFALSARLNAAMDELFSSPRNLPLLEQVSALASLGRSLGFRLDVREAQNRCYELRQWTYPVVLEDSQRDNKEAHWWVERFRELAGSLGIRIPSD